MQVTVAMEQKARIILEVITMPKITLLKITLARITHIQLRITVLAAERSSSFPAGWCA
jgi:hypothetical protein